MHVLASSFSTLLLASSSFSQHCAATGTLRYPKLLLSHMSIHMHMDKPMDMLMDMDMDMDMNMHM